MRYHTISVWERVECCLIVVILHKENIFDFGLLLIIYVCPMIYDACSCIWWPVSTFFDEIFDTMYRYFFIYNVCQGGTRKIYIFVNFMLFISTMWSFFLRYLWYFTIHMFTDYAICNGQNYDQKIKCCLMKCKAT